MKTLTILLAVAVLLSLTSCSGLGIKNPSLNTGTTQDVSGGGKGTYGVGELRTNIKTGRDQSKNYERSNLKTTNENLSTATDLSSKTSSWGGVHTDNSSKTVQTNIDKKAIESSATGSYDVAGNVNVTVGDKKLILTFIEILLLILALAVAWTLFVYRLGKEQRSKRELDIDNRLLNKYLNTPNKLKL